MYKIIGDFYHMNIEDNLAGAARQRDLLGRQHIFCRNVNHRYQPGSSTPWIPPLFRNSCADNYQGYLWYYEGVWAEDPRR